MCNRLTSLFIHAIVFIRVIHHTHYNTKLNFDNHVTNRPSIARSKNGRELTTGPSLHSLGSISLMLLAWSRSSRKVTIATTIKRMIQLEVMCIWNDECAFVLLAAAWIAVELPKQATNADQQS